MGSSRYEVMKTFQKDEKLETLMNIETEELEISEKEFEVITGSRFDVSSSTFINAVYEYYGYSELDIMPVLGVGSKGSGVDILQKKLNLNGATPKLTVNGNFDATTETALKKFQHDTTFPETGKTDKNNWLFLFTEDNFASEYLAYIKEFLSRTGIAYTDLIDLLNTQFLNADQSIILALVIPDGTFDVDTWQSAHACDLYYTRLLHANDEVLTKKEISKFARFIRLWKKSNVSIRDLDHIISGLNFSIGLNANDINHDILWQLPKIIRMSADLHIPIEQLMVFWSNINTWGEKSLYETMFLNQAALQNDNIFRLDATQKQLLNTSEFVNAHIPALLAAFKLKEADLNLIVKTAKIDIAANKLTIEIISKIYRYTSASITGSNIRRADEWEFQKSVSNKEIQQIDKQVLASKIREDISTKDLNNQEQLIENAQITEEFLKNKFTNQELYGWMIGEMATAYFPYYQLVYAWAKTAERLYRFELGITNSNFITFGYWDSFRKGLMAGEKLQLALKQMEKSYLDLNKREYEITKHISLLQHNPLALLTLKETGSCMIELPEYLFDMDYPGQYMRRIKSVTVSIPCVAGPYTSINCTLTLLKSKLRMKNILQGGKYEEQEDDPRFETRLSATNSIATSHAQNDTGMFELNFRDERLLPFEGAGVVSRWQINLPKENNAFDVDTVSDLILQFRYTAREGGKAMADMAMVDVRNSMKNGNRLFSLKHEFPDEWHKCLNTPVPNTDQILQMNLKPDHFPYLISNSNFEITNIALFVDSGLASIPELSLTSPGNTTNQYKFSKLPVKYGALLMGQPSTAWGSENVGLWKLVNPSTNPKKLNPSNCTDIIAIVSCQTV